VFINKSIRAVPCVASEFIDCCCLQCIKIRKFSDHDHYGASLCHKHFGWLCGVPSVFWQWMILVDDWLAAAVPSSG